MMIKINTNNMDDRDIILEQSGIVMAKRDLFLFVDINDYHTNTSKPITTKAILANTSLRNSNKLDNFYKRYDGMLLTKNIYTFNTWLPEGIDNLLIGRFTLRNAYAASFFSYSDREFILPPLKYNHIAKNIDSRYDVGDERNQLISDVIMEVKKNSFETIVPPIYYTSEHMRHTSPDLFSLWNSETDNYFGNQLIDMHHTKITYLDTSIYPNMIKSFQRELGPDIIGSNNPYHIPINTLNDTTITTLTSGMTFIYDSKYKGIDIKGDIYIPYWKYINKEFMLNAINRYAIDFERICNEIKRKYGNITLMYCPMDFGSKLKIDFKDHKVSPIKLPNSLNIDSDTLLDLSFAGLLHFINLGIDDIEEQTLCRTMGYPSDYLDIMDEFNDDENKLWLP